MPETTGVLYAIFYGGRQGDTSGMEAWADRREGQLDQAIKDHGDLSSPFWDPHIVGTGRINNYALGREAVARTRAAVVAVHELNSQFKPGSSEWFRAAAKTKITYQSKDEFGYNSNLIPTPDHGGGGTPAVEVPDQIVNDPSVAAQGDMVTVTKYASFEGLPLLGGPIQLLPVNLPDPIEAGKKILTGATDAISSALNWISNTVGQIFSAVRDLASGVVNFLEGIVRGLVDGIKAGFKAIGDAMGYVVEKVKAVWSAAVDAVGAVTRGIVDKVGAAFKAIGDAIAGLGAAIGNGLKTALGWLWDHVLKPAITGLVAIVKGIWDAIRHAVEAGWKVLQNLMGVGGHERPGEALGTAAIGLAISTGIGMGAEALAKTTEAGYFTKNLDTKTLVAFAYKFAGWDEWLKGIWHSQIDHSVTKPLDYHWNSVYRPRQPDPKLLRELLMKRFIAPAEYRDWSQYHGMRDKWIDLEGRMAFRELTIRDLALLSDTVQLPEDWLYAALRRQGYGDEDIPALAQAILTKGAANEMATARSLAHSMYEAGMLDAAEYRAALTATGIRADWVQPLVDMRDLKISHQEAVEENKALEADFKAARITEDDFRTARGALGFRPTVTESRIRLLSLARDRTLEIALKAEARVQAAKDKAAAAAAKAAAKAAAARPVGA